MTTATTGIGLQRRCLRLLRRGQSLADITGVLEAGGAAGRGGPAGVWPARPAPRPDRLLLT